MYNCFINLRNNHILTFEALSSKRLRLIILNSEKELACRKENLNILEDFIAKTEAELFKGRLQLRKNEHEIMVFFKEEKLGSMTLNAFKNALEETLKHSEKFSGSL